MALFSYTPRKRFTEVAKGKYLYVYTSSAGSSLATLTTPAGDSLSNPIKLDPVSNSTSVQGVYGGTVTFCCSSYNPVWVRTDTPGDILRPVYASLGPAEGAGAKYGSTVTAYELGDGILHKTVLSLASTPVTITDDAEVAQYGGCGKIYDFPEGLILTLGAVVNGAFTLGATGVITNTWAGGFALGTADATTGATLIGTEADIMPEVDIPSATAKVGAAKGGSVATVLTESGARWLQGASTAKGMYLNLVVDDDASHTSGTGTFTGTVTFHWINLGDW